MKNKTLIGYLYTATVSHSGKSMYLEDTNSALHLTSNNTFHQHVDVFSDRNKVLWWWWWWWAWE